MKDSCIPQEFLIFHPQHKYIQGEIFLLPTAIGLYRPLDASYTKIASKLSDYGYIVRILEFPGQNKRPGAYSVVGSCLGLCQFIHKLKNSVNLPIFLFGICAGALASLYSAIRVERIASVFCWELSLEYDYIPETYDRLINKFGLNIDWDNALEPIQPFEIISKIKKPLILGIPQKSRCAKLKEQEHLKSLASSAEIVVLPGTSRIPGIPNDSESIFIKEIITSCSSHIENMKGGVECEKSSYHQQISTLRQKEL